MCGSVGRMPDSRSCRDLTVRGFKPHVRLYADSVEPARDSLSPCLCALSPGGQWGSLAPRGRQHACPRLASSLSVFVSIPACLHLCLSVSLCLCLCASVRVTHEMFGEGRKQGEVGGASLSAQEVPSLEVPAGKAALPAGPRPAAATLFPPHSKSHALTARAEGQTPVPGAPMPWLGRRGGVVSATMGTRVGCCRAHPEKQVGFWRRRGPGWTLWTRR